MSFPRGDTVTVLTAAPLVDPYSGEATARDWDAVTERTVHGVAIAPRTSSEVNQPAQQAVIVGLTLYLPADTVIDAGDRVQVESGFYAGRTFEVDGEPGAWRSPFTGWAPGLEVAVTAVSG